MNGLANAAIQEKQLCIDRQHGPHLGLAHALLDICQQRGVALGRGREGNRLIGHFSASSTVSQRLSVTITNRQRPSDRLAHRPPIRRSSSAPSQAFAPLYSTNSTTPPG